MVTEEINTNQDWVELPIKMIPLKGVGGKVKIADISDIESQISTKRTVDGEEIVDGTIHMRKSGIVKFYNNPSNPDLTLVDYMDGIYPIMLSRMKFKELLGFEDVSEPDF